MLYSTLNCEHIVTSTYRRTHLVSIQKEKALHFTTKHREKHVILRDRGMIGPDSPRSLSSSLHQLVKGHFLVPICVTL